MNEARLPSVDQILKQVADLLREYDRTYVVEQVRRCIADVRCQVREGTVAEERAALGLRVERAVRRCIEREAAPRLHRVVNATGVVLHTGLGRAPLPQTAQEAIARVATGYCNLEFELEAGQRGDRGQHVEALICSATAAEAAAVVNNNAAAVLLLLDTLARGREVVVSRGQQVEIGGSFRLPDVIAASGAKLREVGTTNRTHLRDYERAIGSETGAILVVHPSNYRGPRLYGRSTPKGLGRPEPVCGSAAGSRLRERCCGRSGAVGATARAGSRRESRGRGGRSQL